MRHQFLSALLMLFLALAATPALAQPTTQQEQNYRVYKAFQRLSAAAGDALAADERLDREIAAYIGTDGTVGGQLVGAKIAWIAGQHAKAIALLEQAIKEHGDEPEPSSLGSGRTLAQVAHLWIATISRQSGDVARARRACDDMLKLTQKDSEHGLAVYVLLLRAELEFSYMGDAERALASLKEVAQVSAPSDKNARQGWDIFQEWAAYQSLVIQGKAKDAEAALKPSRLKLEGTVMVSAMHLQISGIVAEPRTGMYNAESGGEPLVKACTQPAIQGKSELDRTAVRFMVAYDHWRQKMPDAEKLYAELFDDHTFFSPEAGLWVARIQRQAGRPADAEATLAKLRERFPAYGPEIESLLKR